MFHYFLLFRVWREEVVDVAQTVWREPRQVIFVRNIWPDRKTLAFYQRPQNCSMHTFAAQSAFKTCCHSSCPVILKTFPKRSLSLYTRTET